MSGKVVRGCYTLRSSNILRCSSIPRASRSFTSISSLRQEQSRPDRPATDPLPPHWLSQTKARIGKCIQFGMSNSQVTSAGLLLAEISRDWRALVAGSEGYLVHPHRAGILSAPIDWGSQDTMGHVNNVQYVRYCESGRTNWTRQIGTYFDPEHKKQWNEMLTSKSIGLILRSIRVDYKFPMTWPDKISVFHKLKNMPDETEHSMTLDVMILSEGKQRIAARAFENVVIYDYKKGKKTSLPGYMLAQFQRQFKEQEEALTENSARVREILRKTRHLEQETWDKEGAKEDMGSGR